jgi:DNA polymerase-3 subunit epsilon
VKIAFVDTETTGLDPERDEVIEVCVSLWDMGTSGPSFSSRFMPHGACGVEAAKVNGFSFELWSKTPAPYFTAEHATKIGNLIAQAGVLGGAATAFDRAFLMKAFERVRVPWPSITHRLVDVQSLALPLVYAGKIEKPSLENIAAYFNLGPVRHTAVDDCFQTIRVFEELLALFCPAVPT